MIFAVHPQDGSTVKTIETILRPEPHKTVAILDNRFHVTRRKPVISIYVSKIITRILFSAYLLQK